MSIIDKAKSHPVFYGIATLVILGGVYYVLASGGSNSTVSSPGVDPSLVAAGAAVQQAQIQATQRNQELEASIQAHKDDVAGQITLESIRTASQNFIANLQAEIAGQQITAGSQDNQLQTTLSAHVAESQIAAGVAAKELESATAITTQNILAGALTAQSQNQLTAYQASLTNAYGITQLHEQTTQKLAEINANTQYQLISAQGQIGLQSAENARPRSWWESLFG